MHRRDGLTGIAAARARRARRRATVRAAARKESDDVRSRGGSHGCSAPD
ncbi:hypothetical protein C7S16_5472 [Burkholderia thailandensis]|uniref:Uncharacterized protein n=1 Tax=Burkholderia thailandensis TaxID=57975 RepID=A0AAW9CQF4_BURTH|nr:hypothetical protein [Burkholderia thailandensis]MDW9252066.1 hypothetical protein [Burkholderia thailandensis]